MLQKLPPIKEWARASLEEAKRDERDLKAQRELLKKLRAQGADDKTLDAIEARIKAMETRVREAKR